MLARIYALVVLRLNFHLCVHIPSISKYLAVSGTEKFGNRLSELVNIIIWVRRHYSLLILKYISVFCY
jgi:hypothetical protein